MYIIHLITVSLYHLLQFEKNQCLLHIPKEIRLGGKQPYFSNTFFIHTKMVFSKKKYRNRSKEIEVYFQTSHIFSFSPPAGHLASMYIPHWFENISNNAKLLNWTNILKKKCSINITQRNTTNLC